jgi:hypothetical protein
LIEHLPCVYFTSLSVRTRFSSRVAAGAREATTRRMFTVHAQTGHVVKFVLWPYIFVASRVQIIKGSDNRGWTVYTNLIVIRIFSYSWVSCNITKATDDWKPLSRMRLHDIVEPKIHKRSPIMTRIVSNPSSPSITYALTAAQQQLVRFTVLERYTCNGDIIAPLKHWIYQNIPYSWKIWRFGGSTSQLKSANIKTFPYFFRAKAIVHREVTWWVWSLGSRETRGRHIALSNHYYCVPIFQGRFLFLL